MNATQQGYSTSAEQTQGEIHQHQLAFTGFDVLPIAGLGLLLLTIGVALMVRLRRTGR